MKMGFSIQTMRPKDKPFSLLSQHDINYWAFVGWHNFNSQLLFAEMRQFSFGVESTSGIPRRSAVLKFLRYRISSPSGAINYKTCPNHCDLYSSFEDLYEQRTTISASAKPTRLARRYVRRAYASRAEAFESEGLH